jgi:hypothetical protein
VNELRVPKQRVEVEILLPGGESRRVAVFLAEFASHHRGGERLSDLLNGPGSFFPAVDVDADQVSFINRAAIAVARVAPAVEPDTSAELTLPTEHEVEITLVDGRTVEGVISFVQPPERSRLMDYLNEAPPFFRVLEEKRVSLVNKAHVALIAAAQK